MKNSLLEEKIGTLLNQYNLKIAVAESCTGGLVCDRITNVPGSSNYFMGGIVSYSNEVKVALLGVTQNTLDLFGAVSKETVMEMAKGVRIRLYCDIGLAVSGIAGPGGGTIDKPVGFIWIGLNTAEKDFTWQHTWGGNRVTIKSKTSQAALMHLYEFLTTHLDS